MSIAKRCFDLFWSATGIVLLSPLFGLIALAIRLDDKGPALFRQERVGYRGKPFRMLKFRTMIVDAERMGKQLTVGRDPRITRVGYWLRKTKLDELPQLINVIRGEMSLVGPRPEVPRYVAAYDAEQRKVLDLRPGITDPASITYYDESDLLAGAPDPETMYLAEVMPEKIRINLEYARRANTLSDLVIILRTILRIANRRAVPNRG